jgi:hypothetical protein
VDTYKDNLAIVVYVIRKQDENSAMRFSRFVTSYKKHPAGFEHKLIIIRKGFQDCEDEWQQWITQLEGIPFELRSYPDRHYFFGYIRLVMEDYPDQYILSCASTTEILVDNWLYLFMKHAKLNRILSHCGCFQSLAGSEMSHSNKDRWENIISKIGRFVSFDYSIKQVLFNRRNVNKLKSYASDLYYPFPNPYLRTSVFMVPPRLLSAIYWPTVDSIQTKYDDYLFESSKYGLSAQALYRDYNLLVVGRDGEAYNIPEWKDSGTFRSKDQYNLVIGDHHTSDFYFASSSQKKMFEDLTYGKGNIDLDSFLSQIKRSTLENAPEFYRKARESQELLGFTN